ncbi:MAG: 23S rRNA (adenine(2030)-N(6))-methyltransferase RlmJ [Gammaproteobacteria bacterium]|nr:23S rRNA (adenine(2030)-N(6))-methyltransferase RlmJ [Gammaproteobacteria bacterium]
MNYRHLYHAGSFADVVKHVVLTLLLQQFLKKETPFCFIDSHAGLGVYDLGSYEARATNEAVTGILRLLTLGSDLPDWLLPYWKIVQTLQSNEKITVYPGSPLIARDFLRPQDKMILNEKHDETYEALKHFFYRDPQVTVHHRDAYEFLPAILPVKDYSRALILIDPPYEKTTEKADLTAALAKALKRFAHGMYAIWFPLTEKMPHLELGKELKALLPAEKNLLIEFSIADPASLEKGLMGCAMIIINPPWQFKDALQEALPSLWKILSIRSQGGWRIFER